MAAGSMTKAEREEFVAAVRVAVLSIEDPGRGPMSVPIWYTFEDGVVVMEMSESTKKVRLLRAAGRASVVVQTEQAPYSYVSIEGPVELVPNDREAGPLAKRYLGEDLGAWYATENPTPEDGVLARLTPEHWNTMDFGKLLGL